MARGNVAAALAIIALLVGGAGFIFAARPDVVSQPEAATTCSTSPRQTFMVGEDASGGCNGFDLFNTAITWLADATFNAVMNYHPSSCPPQTVQTGISVTLFTVCSPTRSVLPTKGTLASSQSPNYSNGSPNKMVGLAMYFTPLTSTSIQMSCTLFGYNNTNNDGYQAIIYVGTGAAPVQGATVTGTQEGLPMYITLINPGVSTTESTTWAGPGFTIGTTYWFDLAWGNLLGGTATLQTTFCTISDFG